jgi:hypothetical protein
MPVHRSPNCPQISFTEAAIKGRKVYEKEHTHPAPKAAVAEDLGYSGINGRALSIIGALRQYGILEGPSEGLRITDDAVAFYELEEGPERNEALYRMVFAPPFFESLRQQFGDSLPSESTLKHHLIREGFLPRAADEVIGVYRENVDLIRSTPKRPSEPMQNADTSLTLTPNLPFHPLSAQPTATAHTGSLSFSFPLSLETRAELHIRGTISGDELEMLRDQIEMTIKALKRTQSTSRTSCPADTSQLDEGR